MDNSNQSPFVTSKLSSFNQVRLGLADDGSQSAVKMGQSVYSNGSALRNQAADGEQGFKRTLQDRAAILLELEEQKRSDMRAQFSRKHAKFTSTNLTQQVLDRSLNRNPNKN